jgi:ADP-ribose pyrophosphatase YjhB (NUDIX family)
MMFGSPSLNSHFFSKRESMSSEISNWFTWAREIYSLSQAGLAYSQNVFDIERYKRLQEISAEIIASQTGLEKQEIINSFSIQAGYPTPKVDVRGAVVRDGKILLIKEKVDGKWAMPGGWGDLGDSPAEMVAREVWEESGFSVHVDKLIAVIDANRFQPFEFYHAYKLIFLCTITGGEATPSIETDDVDFFLPEALPLLSENRTNHAMIAEVYAHLIDPNRPAQFN